MPERNISSITQTDMKTIVTDFSVDTASTDGATEQKETEFMNSGWAQQFGYYKTIPEIGIVVDAKATWTVGKGFKADEETTMILDSLKGIGNESFNVFLENMIRTYHIGGDSFAEIIRDEEENLINLKPLDPEGMKVVANRQGIIIRYEQTSKIKETPKKFQTDEILHFTRNRVADNILGTSMIDKLTTIILARNEAMEDKRIVSHRTVVPVRIIEVDTDDAAEIAKVKTQYEQAILNKEVLIIPKGTVTITTEALSNNATLDTSSWIRDLNAYFYQAAGVPQIIVGGSNEITEATAKILYLTFQQTIEEEQLYVEEQILSQLNLVIELEFPVSLENDLLSDKAKDEETSGFQPNDTTAGSGE